MSKVSQGPERVKGGAAFAVVFGMGRWSMA